MADLSDRSINIRHKEAFREREYVASVRWSLLDMANHFRGLFSYTSSDLFTQLVNQRGKIVIIEDIGLPAHHWNFLICLFQEWIFAFRRNNPDQRQFDIIQVLEDASAICDPAQDRATPGGVSLLAHNLNLCREMRIYVTIVSHSIKQISEKMRCNISNYCCCSLRGDDLTLAQQVLGITRPQAEFLRVNPVGTACILVPCIWPLPTLISYPNILELIQ